MKQPNHRGDSSKLQSLERWRSAALEQSQFQHIRRQKLAAEYAQVVDECQGTIDESQNLARSHMTMGCIISVESLTRIRHFASVQSIELQQATATLERSREEVARARTIVGKKLEELAVVERLRERRGDEANKESLRVEQKRLDEQALLRVTQATIGLRKITR